LVFISLIKDVCNTLDFETQSEEKASIELFADELLGNSYFINLLKHDDTPSLDVGNEQFREVEKGEVANPALDPDAQEAISNVELPDLFYNPKIPEHSVNIFDKEDKDLVAEAVIAGIGIQVDLFGEAFVGIRHENRIRDWVFSQEFDGDFVSSQLEIGEYLREHILSNLTMSAENLAKEVGTCINKIIFLSIFDKYSLHFFQLYVGENIDSWEQNGTDGLTRNTAFKILDNYRRELRYSQFRPENWENILQRPILEQIKDSKISTLEEWKTNEKIHARYVKHKYIMDQQLAHKWDSIELVLKAVHWENERS